MTTASVAQALAANTRLHCWVLRLFRPAGRTVRELGQPSNRLCDVSSIAPRRLDRRPRSEVGIDECKLGALSPGASSLYESSRSARRRRFSSAVALRARSTGVARASEVADCFAHRDRSSSDISRITRSPDATCALTWSSFAARASCSRSVRVFAIDAV